LHSDPPRASLAAHGKAGGHAVTGLRVLLVVLWTVMTAVTVVVIAKHGWNLFPVFFGDIAELSWRGQFNVDFMSYLALTAAWLMWRHEFSPAGIMLGVVGFFGGALFLTVYLFVVSFTAKGDMREILMGQGRSARISG